MTCGTIRFCTILLALVLNQASIDAENAFLDLSPVPGGFTVQINGDGDDEWRLQASPDFLTWTNLASFGVLLSKGSNPPARLIQDSPGDYKFYRTARTEGLYDPSVFRTFSLTFTQANWATRLASGRTTGSNTVAELTADNGAHKVGVGVRYKGNTSYTMAGVKKSLNLELDFVDETQDMMGFRTVNLNNAFGDETIMREAIYFSVMSQFAVSPKASMARLFINGADWGVYSLTEQENKDLVKRWFPSGDGDRWRAPNNPSTTTAFNYMGGTNISRYRTLYELKSTEQADTNVAWMRLINAIGVLNTNTVGLKEKVDTVFAVDRWLWFFAVENVFADDDSYWNKGADYGFYFEPESGRIHPIEHDGNEAFVSGDVSLSPVQGAALATRPLLYKLLPIPEYRQRYLAHMRTILEQGFQPDILFPLITNFHQLSINAIIADPKKGFTMASYTNDLNALKSFVTRRYAFLTNHAELKPLQPLITQVNGSQEPITASTLPLITAYVEANGTNGVDSVWLYFRGKSYGQFTVAQMFDDGAHGDGAPGEGLFGAAIPAFPAGTRVRYYIEARSANAAKAARFSPARAEEETYSYRVGLTTAPNTPVVINEVMAANVQTVADPQGEFEDWIELRNLTATNVDLSGWHLSDEPNNPRKWQFPTGTTIPGDGYLVIWADEDGKATEGLHASFKLSSGGEELFLTDSDENLNAILDRIEFGELADDRSYGREGDNSDAWSEMTASPGGPND